MKLDQLRKIIREEVRAAVKEELQEVMNEAVKVASTPSKMAPAPKAGTTSWSAPKGRKPSTLDEMLTMTKNNMTSEEYKNIFTGTSDMVSKPNFASSMANQMGLSGSEPGLDISKLDFVKKAKSVLDAAEEKTKARLG